jgi:cytochrome c553
MRRDRLVFYAVCGALPALATMLAAPAPLLAGDAKAGRQKALQCQTCHGLDGTSKLPEAPNLAGQVEMYLVKAMTDYKTGARKNDMMSLVAPTLNDQDIADLAAYFASIEVQVQPPK